MITDIGLLEFFLVLMFTCMSVVLSIKSTAYRKSTVNGIAVVIMLVLVTSARNEFFLADAFRIQSLGPGLEDELKDKSITHLQNSLYFSCSLITLVAGVLGHYLHDLRINRK